MLCIDWIINWIVNYECSFFCIVCSISVRTIYYSLYMFSFTFCHLFQALLETDKKDLSVSHLPADDSLFRIEFGSRSLLLSQVCRFGLHHLIISLPLIVWFSNILCIFFFERFAVFETLAKILTQQHILLAKWHLTTYWLNSSGLWILSSYFMYLDPLQFSIR
jgi:hypothetical protein